MNRRAALILCWGCRVGGLATATLAILAGPAPLVVLGVGMMLYGGLYAADAQKPQPQVEAETPSEPWGRHVAAYLNADPLDPTATPALLNALFANTHPEPEGEDITAPGYSRIMWPEELDNPCSIKFTHCTVGHEMPRNHYIFRERKPCGCPALREARDPYERSLASYHEVQIDGFDGPETVRYYGTPRVGKTFDALAKLEEHEKYLRGQLAAYYDRTARPAQLAVLPGGMKVYPGDELPPLV